jgi:hypothetical protein
LAGPDPDFFASLIPYLGAERVYNESYPYKSFFDADVNVTVASDFVTTEPDLMSSIYTGMERILAFEINEQWYGGDGGRSVTDPNVKLEEGDSDHLSSVEERLSLEEMLKAATINGAYANFLENEVGSLEVGKKADIVVLSENPFKIEKEKIPSVEIEMTFFEGKRVY